MKQELKTKWIEALRSGKYTQTVGGLRDNDGHCCLGVACDVFWLDQWIDKYHHEKQEMDNGEPEGEFLADETCQELGLKIEDMYILYHMNDGIHLTDKNKEAYLMLESCREYAFSEIADFIEKYVE